jgi:hypothetical protein
MNHPSWTFNFYQHLVAILYLIENRGYFLTQIISRTGFDIALKPQDIESLALLRCFILMLTGFF